MPSISSAGPREAIQVWLGAWNEPRRQGQEGGGDGEEQHAHHEQACPAEQADRERSQGCHEVHDGRHGVLQRAGSLLHRAAA
jgi:hypothetical protein